MSKKCPKCGSGKPFVEKCGCITFECGTRLNCDARQDVCVEPEIVEHSSCLRRQLAAVTTERDEQSRQLEILENDVHKWKCVANRADADYVKVASERDAANETIRKLNDQLEPMDMALEKAAAERDAEKERADKAEAACAAMATELADLAWEDNLDETACPTGSESCRRCGFGAGKCGRGRKTMPRGHTEDCVVGQLLKDNPGKHILDRLAAQQEQIERLREALQEISRDTDCMGPGCPYCEDDEKHPASNAAKIALATLEAMKAKEADDGRL